jgi:hypothetical protein
MTERQHDLPPFRRNARLVLHLGTNGLRDLVVHERGHLYHCRDCALAFLNGDSDLAITRPFHRHDADRRPEGQRTFITKALNGLKQGFRFLGDGLRREAEFLVKRARRG